MRSLLLSSLLAVPALAHEAWLSNEDGGVVVRLGEDFTGEARGFSRERTAALRTFGDGGWRTVTVRDAGLVSLPVAGASVVSYDSQPSTLTLEAIEFNAYLREEGHQAALASRADAGEMNLPGRERYARSLKTLVGPGAFSVRTGQRLELVPASDPLRTKPGHPLTFRLVFEGAPLAGALVLAWSWQGDNLVRISSHTKPDGTVTFTLPHLGRWMISTVHLQRLVGVPLLDWESVWTSLTFDLRRLAGAE